MLAVKNPDLSVYPRFYSPSRLVSYKQPSRRLRGGVELTDFVTTQSWKQPFHRGMKGKLEQNLELWRYLLVFQRVVFKILWILLLRGGFRVSSSRNGMSLPTRYFGHFSWRAFEKACMVRNTKTNPRGIFPSKDLGFWPIFLQISDGPWGLKWFTYIDTIIFSHSFI